MEIDRKIIDIASDFESQLKAHRAELSRNNSKINKELRKLSETDKSLELSIQSSKLTSVDNEAKSPDRRNSPDHTLLSDPSTAGDAQHEIERSTLPLNRSTPREAFDRQEPLDPNSDPNRDDDQPILILTDSMLRGIIQSKFAPNRYTNKQYIQGGTEHVLKATLTKRTLTDESLPTLMCNVEFIVNGRPLTKSSHKPHDQ